MHEATSKPAVAREVLRPMATARAKVCKTCSERKPLEAFPTHRMSRDGRRATCSGCLLSGRYEPRVETPAQRARRKARQSQPRWQASHADALRRLAAQEPIKAQAMKAARKALRSGIIQNPGRCQAAECSSAKHIEMHHWSYAPEHWTDVLFVCASDHRQGHARGYIVPAAGIPRRYGQIPGVVIASSEGGSNGR